MWGAMFVQRTQGPKMLTWVDKVFGAAGERNLWDRNVLFICLFIQRAFIVRPRPGYRGYIKNHPAKLLPAESFHSIGEADCVLNKSAH